MTLEKQIYQDRKTFHLVLLALPLKNPVNILFSLTCSTWVSTCIPYRVTMYPNYLPHWYMKHLYLQRLACITLLYTDIQYKVYCYSAVTHLFFFITSPSCCDHTLPFPPLFVQASSQHAFQHEGSSLNIRTQYILEIVVRQPTEMIMLFMPLMNMSI